MRRTPKEDKPVGLRSIGVVVEDGVVLNFYAAGSVHVDGIRLVRDSILRDFDDEVVVVRQVACDKSQAAGSRKYNAYRCAFKSFHTTAEGEGVTTLRRRRRNPPAIARPDPNRIKLEGSGTVGSSTSDLATI